MTAPELRRRLDTMLGKGWSGVRRRAELPGAISVEGPMYSRNGGIGIIGVIVIVVVILILVGVIKL
jgi:hypothetical protein